MAGNRKQPAVIATNPTARHHFTILDTVEAGIRLTGTEVKSIRENGANLRDAFAKIEKGRAILYQCDIAPYSAGNIHNHAPRRERQLLLHKREIAKLFQEAQVKGRTLVALEMYWKNGHIKVLLGIAQGKTKGDKRETLKSQDTKRELSRLMKNLRR